jgi:hypothetical protein
VSVGGSVQCRDVVGVVGYLVTVRGSEQATRENISKKKIIHHIIAQRIE